LGSNHWIWIYATIPFGLFTISGAITQSFNKGPYTADRPIYTLSGIASTREIAVYGYYGNDFNPGTSGVITLSGNLVHPNIDYTPHYGIEENIGIGTTGIQITGISTAIEKLVVNLIWRTLNSLVSLVVIVILDLVLILQRILNSLPLLDLW
jgi:hypothetical protein